VITEGHLARHYQGRSGGRGPALIDIAQDHLLYRLAERGLFGLGIALKGGTAIRKLWAGNAGRFSTDLDFAGLDDAAADLLLEAVDCSAYPRPVRLRDARSAGVDRRGDRRREAGSVWTRESGARPLRSCVVCLASLRRGPGPTAHGPEGVV
jgi:predicted nucleotidyltransferase component of viral defense system